MLARGIERANWLLPQSELFTVARIDVVLDQRCPQVSDRRVALVQRAFAMALHLLDANAVRWRGVPTMHAPAVEVELTAASSRST
jgi:hypothetical protein